MFELIFGGGNRFIFSFVELKSKVWLFSLKTVFNVDYYQTMLITVISITIKFKFFTIATAHRNVISNYIIIYELITKAVKDVRLINLR